ncbi:hypothetical protein V7S43_007486 [Phytophthora oleae]|uniref:Kazal-like domain-containing protein n=1 Tax=Phytophthora oleae TaxID=2107226 RepID=A0ABD3FKH0_9STRA
MKFAICLVLVAAAIVSSHADKSGSECAFDCPAWFDSVCGSDGITYWTACDLDLANCHGQRNITQVSAGVCPTAGSTSGSDKACAEVCIETHDPVCGSNGVTYTNSCYLGIAKCHDPSITQVSTGTCSSSGNSDSSSKEDNSDSGTSSSSSTTDCPTSCAAVYFAVCGSDGVVYSNECELKVTACNDPALNPTKASDESCADAC